MEDQHKKKIQKALMYFEQDFKNLGVQCLDSYDREMVEKYLDASDLFWQFFEAAKNIEQSLEEKIYGKSL